MSGKIEQVRNNLRARIRDIDDRINELMGGLDSARANAKADIDAQIGKARAGLEARKDELERVQTRVQASLDEKMAQTEESVRGWIHDRNVERLEGRAQLAESYAKDSVWLALAAVEDAECAALEAVAARIEADEAATG